MNNDASRSGSAYCCCTAVPASTDGAKETTQRGPEAVKALLPRIGISTHTLRRLEAIQLVRDQRDTGAQEVSYHARPFVLCGLPIRQPATNQLVYSRRNDHFLLEITAHRRFGLPYGQDRLIPIWLAPLAHKQRSRTVHFSSPSELPDYFHRPKTALSTVEFELPFSVS